METKTEKFGIYPTCLNCYNNGYLVGYWYKFDQNESIQDLKKAMSIPMIHAKANAKGKAKAKQKAAPAKSGNGMTFLNRISKNPFSIRCLGKKLNSESPGKEKVTIGVFFQYIV